MATETFGSVTVISDVGATANSYVSVAETKAQWALDPNKDASGFTDEQIAVFVIYATEVTDAENWALYDGYLFNPDYALFFPRAGLTDSRGVKISDMTIFPKDLKKSVIEQAYYLSSNDVFATLNLNGVKSQSLTGVGSKTFYDLGEYRAALKKNVMSDLAKKYLSALLIGGSAGSDYTARFVRG